MVCEFMIYELYSYSGLQATDNWGHPVGIEKRHKPMNRTGGIRGICFVQELDDDDPTTFRWTSCEAG